MIARWSVLLLLLSGLAGPAMAADPGAEPEPVTLDVDRVDLRALLQTLAELAGLNLVLGDAVSGQLTLSLRQVPWSQALQAILHSHGLVARRDGDLLWVGSQRQLLERDQQSVEAQQAAELAGPLLTRSWRLRYALAAPIASWLQGQAAASAAGGRWLSARGIALADSRTNLLFVSDTAERLQRVEQLLAGIDQPARQVLIEARLVEASRQFGRSLGVRLGQHRPPAPASGAAGQIIDLPAGLLPNPVLDGIAAPALAITLLRPQAGPAIELELSALEAQGRGRVLASPRIITAELQQAAIEQGSEIPYQHASSSGATAVSFVKAVLGLRVTPQITPDGQVLMQVEIHKDSLGAATPAGPAINTNSLSTQVRVEDGGTVVLGGIASSDDRDQVAKVPLLGDLPGLGALFRSHSRSRQNSELLVFLTPHIVDAAAPNR